MRLLITWVLNALAFLGIAYFLAPNVTFLSGYHVESFEAAAVAVAVLAVLNVTVRPILKLLALPISCLTFGLFALLINGAMLLVTDSLVKGFELGGLKNAVIVSVLYAVISAILNAIFNPKSKDDDDD